MRKSEGKAGAYREIYMKNKDENTVTILLEMYSNK